jgi:hypothetical protein
MKRGQGNHRSAAQKPDRTAAKTHDPGRQPVFRYDHAQLKHDPESEGRFSDMIMRN